MSDESTDLLEVPTTHQRILGRIRGERTGPTMVVMTGIHGNEQSGLQAARRVLDRLAGTRATIRGELTVLAGNLRALEARTRFIDRDLNRQWTAVKLDEAKKDDPDNPVTAEHAEQLELLDVIPRVVRECRGRLYFLDLHTSSAEGAPFLTVGDTLRNRSFALQVPLPVILGLEEQVDGALLEFLNNFGFVTMGVEAGQHDLPESIDRHEAVLWLSLVAAGILQPAEVPDLERHRNLLLEASRGIPSIVEVRHRHAICLEDRFKMEPGFKNFQQIRKGQTLARDARGGVLAPDDGLLLLPLYQGQGDDGFFVAREVRRFWLRVSLIVRKLQLAGLIRFLPGVRRDEQQPDVLIVNTRVARVYPLEIFHLFGFRKLRRVGAELIVSRRKFDLEEPDQIRFN